MRLLIERAADGDFDTEVCQWIARALADAGAVKKIIIVASASAIHVNIITKNDSVTATTLKGSIKTWATIDASAKWVRKLDIGKAQLEISQWQPGQRGLEL